MSLVEAKCPKCGAIIKVESSDEAGVCDICKVPFVVERAIKLFNIVGNTLSATSKDSSKSVSSDFAVRGTILEKYGGRSENVVIPDGVMHIGNRAFSLCPFIKSVTFPKGLKYIGNYAFECCTGITELIIPASVTAIADSAFKGCTNLKKAVLPPNLKTIEPHVFEFCSSITKIDLPITIKRIGNYAFERCTGLRSIHIPEGVTSIGNSAFENCTDLTTVYIPNSVTFLGMSAFEGCTSLANVRLPKNFEFSVYIFAKNPWGSMQRDRKRELQFKWIEQGLCQYCGGEIGLLEKCKVCGKKQ